MIKETFLVEIGTEELPPKSLRKIAESFTEQIIFELKRVKLIHGEIIWFASPRRIALKIINLNSTQLDYEVENRGPSVIASFDSIGNATKAAKLWAHSNSITVNEADRLITTKGAWLVHRKKIIGKSIEILLPIIINTVLKKLPISKLMRWGIGDINFIRPIHTITMIFGDKLITGKILGIESTRIILGHRFMGKKTIFLQHADQYPKILEKQGKVIVDYQKRKTIIKKNAVKIANKLGGIVDINDSLLEEVVSLVEWPVVLSGTFEDKFLKIPSEAIVATMKSNQKYFPIYDVNNKLLPYFIFVANIKSSNPKEIISGNEKVIRPRLSDAEFFFKEDCKNRLESNLNNLKSVIFQKELGSLRDKTDRIIVLVTWIATKIGANVDYARRAALLSKCDLVSNMVFEFTDTQGVMGMHYARHDGEEENIALALGEQYLPRFSDDNLPSTILSCILAIADKIDTLTGIFTIGKQPKNDKDPFGLRRIAIGILRIIIEKKLSIDLQSLIKESVLLYKSKFAIINIIDNIINFIFNRLIYLYQKKGYNINILRSVLGGSYPTCLINFDLRVKAISHFYTLNESIILIDLNKRLSKILTKSTETLNDNIKYTLLEKKEELLLVSFIDILTIKVKLYSIEGLYLDMLLEFVKVYKIVENFFKKVIINVNEDDIRINRLTILSKLRNLFLQIADFSLLQ